MNTIDMPTNDLLTALSRPMRCRCLGLLALLALALAACAPPTVAPTPTPTRTPKPPTPTLTLTPSPTPTPAFPVRVTCTDAVPEAACAHLRDAVADDPAHFAWAGANEAPDILLRTENPRDARRVGTWTYAVTAPFFTVQDEVALEHVRASWFGEPQGPFAERPLLVSPATRAVLSATWGAPSEAVVRVVAAGDLLSESQALSGWAIVPFHRLAPQWKVLRVNGVSLLEKGLPPERYPLEIPLYLHSPTRPETLALLPDPAGAYTNRDEGQMTLVVMTGVTAITRGTAQLIDRTSPTYPAKDVKHWFEDADFVHVSNEVSFKPDCVAEGSGTLSFCSHDRYIALLEEINTNIVELTGNHLEDKGTQWVDHSLEMYRERGWRWFGGGANRVAAARPLTLTHGANALAFIGCNTVGPFAGEDSGGAARCDFEQVRADVRALRDAGYLPIVTLQYLEDYSYAPTPQQIRDFRYLAEAGAVMVQGSQAHQAQTMEFHEGTFIHYGLGNFFFDQMWSDGTRQQFVDRLVFYDGRLLSIDLRTAILEEYGRPRPMTVGDPAPEADRALFLQMIFDLRPQ
jgi:poly-gamma-glutamate synthesis protein (capsule biosynthesis protein)